MLRIITPFQQFLRYEASSGVLLILIIIAALLWINISGSSYTDVWYTYLSISFGKFSLSKPITLWINDLLMAVFFLLVGLEVKRELLVGELNEMKKAILPIAAAVGGIVVPSLIFLLFNANSPENLNGWAIPAATDIAFALGVLYLLGDRVPSSARVFLATLAIIDDIVAILIIAIFYTTGVSIAYLLFSIVMFVLLLVLNRLNIRSLLPYMIIGTVLWYGLFSSGVHATIAGVFLALTIPATTKIDHSEFRNRSSELINQLAMMKNEDPTVVENTSLYMDTIATLEHSCQDVQAPLQRLEHSLAPWVAFLIMPIFALANAGVILSSDSLSTLSNPLSIGIVLGLVVGKPVGILIFSLLVVKLGLAKLPENLYSRHVLGLGLLAGIGFTMSTFISALAFESDVQSLEASKVAILLASLISGTLGFLVLQRTHN